MRAFLGLIISLLMIAGCSSHRGKAVAEQELSNIQSDKAMLAPEWFRKGYFVWANKDNTLSDAWIMNSFFLRMLGLHAFLWIVPTACIVISIDPPKLPAGSSEQELNDDLGCFMVLYVFGGIIVGLGAPTALWLLIGMATTCFSPNTHIPFDFVCFLTLVGVYAVTTAIIVNTFISKANDKAPQQVVTMPPSYHSSPTNADGVSKVSSRAQRTARAMLRALFVAVASAIGSQIGGWIGGILVFAISAGISAYFGIPSEGLHPQTSEAPNSQA